MKIKTPFFSLLLVILSFGGYGQKFTQRELPPNLQLYDDAPYHFGFTLSLSSWGMSIDPKNFYFEDYVLNDGTSINVERLNPSNHSYYKVLDIETKYFSPGFAVAIVGDLRIGDYLNLRFVPGLSFTQQYLYFTLASADEKNPSEPKEIIMAPDPRAYDKVECVFLDMPLMLKCKGKRLHNVRPYVIGGVEGKVNFLAGVGYENHTADELSSLRLKPFDLMYTLGGGFDFYMFWFKFGVELRMGYSIFDTHDHLDNKHLCTNAIDKLKAKEFQVIFTFE